jgi:hypothetical protein
LNTAPVPQKKKGLTNSKWKTTSFGFNQHEGDCPLACLLIQPAVDRSFHTTIKDITTKVNPKTAAGPEIKTGRSANPPARKAGFNSETSF